MARSLTVRQLRLCASALEVPFACVDYNVIGRGMAAEPHSMVGNQSQFSGPWAETAATGQLAAERSTQAQIFNYLTTIVYEDADLFADLVENIEGYAKHYRQVIVWTNASFGKVSGFDYDPQKLAAVYAQEIRRILPFYRAVEDYMRKANKNPVVSITMG